jgi:hypothetical protein
VTQAISHPAVSRVIPLPAVLARTITLPVIAQVIPHPVVMARIIPLPVATKAIPLPAAIRLIVLTVQQPFVGTQVIRLNSGIIGTESKHTSR